MYQERLQAQWENLIADFKADYTTHSAQGPWSVSAMNDWYRTRSYRWNSIVNSEGLLLEQTQTPEFEKAFKAQLAAFELKPTQRKPLPPKWLGAVAGVGGGAVIGILMKLLLNNPTTSRFYVSDLGIVITVLVVVVASISAYSGKRKKMQTKLYNNRIQECEQQLTAQGEKLARLCGKYHIS